VRWISLVGEGEYRESFIFRVEFIRGRGDIDRRCKGEKAVIADWVVMSKELENIPIKWSTEFLSLIFLTLAWT